MKGLNIYLLKVEVRMAIHCGDLHEKIEINKYKSFSMLKSHAISKVVSRLFLFVFIVFVVILFLPWTQNLRVNGYMTTLYPEQKPQTINTIIGGKIAKWYVREGQLVRKGDTIVQITEVKDEYFDPNLLSRVKEQIDAKNQSITSYREKADALEKQIEALRNTRDLKLSQTKNYYQQTILKVQSDSIDFVAAEINFKISKEQLLRFEDLYKQGLKSLTELEQRKLRFQDANAKFISAENKFRNSKNDMANANMEINSQLNQYNEKLAKAESDKWEALSNLYTAEAELSKLRIMFQNYETRSGLYFITAPQDGYITKSIKTGIGEIVKEGEEIVTIAPYDYQAAVEMYINPMDIPLIKSGQNVRIVFDGWPSIIFSGWPQLSIGAFAGKVISLDYYISENGKYRALIGPDPNAEPWPDVLRVGSGAIGMILLNDVPIWYETWRQLNGFPPDYYSKEEEKMEKVKKEANGDKNYLKSLK